MTATDFFSILAPVTFFVLLLTLGPGGRCRTDPATNPA
jgi:hypothetical protein